MPKRTNTSRMPWYRTSFDLEGLAFGALALCLAVLLGLIWDPLFWPFFAAFFVIMFASRDAERTTPSEVTGVIAPCDGIVTSVLMASPPRELRVTDGEVVRIRISTSPFAVNGIRSPVTGTVTSFLEETGAPAVLCFDPDNEDMREAFLLIEGQNGQIGTRIATGGLGPRLDLEIEQDDTVRAGRKIGVRRLGGWCDIYLPSSMKLRVRPGQSLIGGETVLAGESEIVAPGSTMSDQEEDTFTSSTSDEAVDSVAPPLTGVVPPKERQEDGDFPEGSVRTDQAMPQQPYGANAPSGSQPADPVGSLEQSEDMNVPNNLVKDVPDSQGGFQNPSPVQDAPSQSGSNDGPSEEDSTDPVYPPRSSS